MGTADQRGGGRRQRREERGLRVTQTNFDGRVREERGRRKGKGGTGKRGKGAVGGRRWGSLKGGQELKEGQRGGQVDPSPVILAVAHKARRG